MKVQGTTQHKHKGHETRCANPDYGNNDDIKCKYREPRKANTRVVQILSDNSKNNYINSLTARSKIKSALASVSLTKVVAVRSTVSKGSRITRVLQQH